MESPIQDRVTTDINATVRKHAKIIPGLLAANALTGCDTVASLYGLGKATVLKKLSEEDHDLSLIGDSTLQPESYGIMVQQATRFILSCYGQSQAQSLTDARKKSWRKKMAKCIADTPKLCRLPPTTEAALENILRAHLQTAVWKGALEADPPKLDPLKHGWTLVGEVMTPKLIADGVPLTPPKLLALIKCGCGKPGTTTENTPCKSGNCSRKSSNLPCSIFCVCQGGDRCQNTH